MNDAELINAETLTSLRYCFQRILVPIVVVIGVLGNTITVAVLTRRRMRCSTNIYLSALAMADMVYLLFIFILSLEHYPNINNSKYRLYWSAFGLSHWFCDASAYASIYLTVSFTIERYIAVCHPIRGQVLCTESRAKRVIAVVTFLCFFLTITTAFEYKLSQNIFYVDKITNKVCEEKFKNLTTINHVLGGSLSKDKENTTIENLQSISTGKNLIPLSSNLSDIRRIDKTNSCIMVQHINAVQSDFGENEVYKEIFYILSSTFGTFIPLILLATFNCFLVAAVHRSHKIRHKMTNTRQSDASSAQENKVTVTLIAVVVLFLVCQTPAAIQLIYTMKAKQITNTNRALNNLCNFLVTLNAACNFLLYCALSDKYRKTVKELFFGRRPVRSNTISSSRYVSGITSTSSIYSKAPNSSRNSIVRNRVKTPNELLNKNQFSISPEEYASLKSEIAKRQAISQSIMKGTRNASNCTAQIPLVNMNQNPLENNNLQKLDEIDEKTALNADQYNSKHNET